MSLEGQTIDKKSLRVVTGRTTDFPELAKDCVAFANAHGGRLLIGIEDDRDLPPADQQINLELLDAIRKRITELTVNVTVLPQIIRADNGGQFIDLTILRSQAAASTSDGRFFQRIGDRCVPIVGDDILRLADERPGRPWEAMDSRVPRGETDFGKMTSFVEMIRKSERVKASVKEKSHDELLTHYGLADGATLTHLGVLLLGTTSQRRNLGTAPLVQVIKYDELEQKINKWLWDDYSFSPLELVDAVWREIPDFRESYEIAEGLYRRQVPAFDEKVVRELLVNALVHRPYTQRGDIFLNLYPDRLEIVNPGRLPLGVTPHNILHASRRRNDGLACVFHDVGLMEKEGSGYDMLFDRLLSSGRPAPVMKEGADSVKVTITRRIMKPEVIKLVTEADARYQLTQRERITLGALAQHEGLTARELCRILEVETTDELTPWFGRLLTLNLVKSTGRTQATRYFVEPGLLRDSGITLPTTLKRIEPHRLQELIREDLRRYPQSKIGEISTRIGPEVNRSQLKRGLAELVRLGAVCMNGERNTARYYLVQE